MYCKYCGRLNDEDALFCKECGMPFTKEEENNQEQDNNKKQNNNPNKQKTKTKTKNKKFFN